MKLELLFKELLGKKDGIFHRHILRNNNTCLKYIDRILFHIHSSPIQTRIFKMKNEYSQLLTNGNLYRRVYPKGNEDSPTPLFSIQPRRDSNSIPTALRQGALHPLCVCRNELECIIFMHYVIHKAAAGC